MRTRKIYFSRVAGALLALFFCLTSRAAELTVDTSNREATRAFYQANYLLPTVAMGWTGSVASGNEGTTSAAFKDSVYRRINYFRAMAGLYAGVVDEPSFSASAQKAAFMMSSNNDLSHVPPSTWLNYSEEGATAAGRCNLAFAFSGAAAIDSYVEDFGATNGVAGHRRYILYPQTTRMGTGDISASRGYTETNALWIRDDATYFGPRPPVRDTFVAWPPKGFVPYNLVYPRWSFSYPGADFSAATVSLRRNGAAVPVRQEALAAGYGENTLVFIPDNLDPSKVAEPVAPASDKTTTVNIGNVLIDGAPQSFSYDVTVFNAGAASLPPAATRTLRLGGSLTFGSRKVKTKTYRTLTISNYGNSPLTVTSIKYPTGFSGRWSGKIPAMSRVSIKVTFRPTAKKAYSGVVTVRANSTSGTKTRSISGRGR